MGGGRIGFAIGGDGAPANPDVDGVAPQATRAGHIHHSPPGVPLTAASPSPSPVARAAQAEREKTRKLKLDEPGKRPDLSIDAQAYFAHLDVRPGSSTLATHHQFERDLLLRVGPALRVVGDPKASAAAKGEAAKLLLYTAMMMKSTHEGYWAGSLKGEDIVPFNPASQEKTDPSTSVLQREERTIYLLQAAQSVIKSPRLTGFITISQARVEQLRDGTISKETFARVSYLIHEDKVFTLATALTGLHGLTLEQRNELADLSRGVIRNRLLISLIPFMHGDANPASTKAPYGREAALVAIGDALVLDLLRRGEWSFAAGQDWKFAQSLYLQAQKGFGEDKPKWKYADAVGERVDAMAHFREDFEGKTKGLNELKELLTSERSTEMRSCASCHSNKR